VNRSTLIVKSVALALLLLVGQASAFPMKPDIKLLLKQAQRPRTQYVPARAGWNGPEDKSALASPNPTYEELRREPTPAEMRAELLAAAIPDWRILLAIAGLILVLRVSVRSTGKTRLAPVFAFPPAARPDVTGAPNVAEAA
jgi:hypothetical protein